MSDRTEVRARMMIGIRHCPAPLIVNLNWSYAKDKKAEFQRDLMQPSGSSTDYLCINDINTDTEIALRCSDISFLVIEPVDGEERGSAIET